MSVRIPRPAWAVRTGLRQAGLARCAARFTLAFLLVAAVALACALVGDSRPADAHQIRVTGISITGSAGSDNQYHAGDVIAIELTFSQNITQWNSPWGQYPQPRNNSTRLPIQVGSNSRTAYAEAVPAGGNADATIEFRYTVTAADQDADGISVATGAVLTTTGIWHVNAQSGQGTPGTDIGTDNALPDSLNSGQASHKVNANTIDYDGDGDGLIEISNLAQLNAIRYDLDGDHNPTSANIAAYAAAFPRRSADNGCPDNADGNSDADDYDCNVYELLNDLDFDTDDDGATHTNGVGDDGDAYYNGGAGWDPIGAAFNTNSLDLMFGATFRGNGRLCR